MRCGYSRSRRASASRRRRRPLRTSAVGAPRGIRDGPGIDALAPRETLPPPNRLRRLHLKRRGGSTNPKLAGGGRKMSEKRTVRTANCYPKQAECERLTHPSVSTGTKTRARTTRRPGAHVRRRRNRTADAAGARRRSYSPRRPTGTRRTGVGLARTTFSETLPSRSLSTPRRPCVPITTRSASSAAASISR